MIVTVALKRLRCLVDVVGVTAPGVTMVDLVRVMAAHFECVEAAYQCGAVVLSGPQAEQALRQRRRYAADGEMIGAVRTLCDAAGLDRSELQAAIHRLWQTDLSEYRQPEG